MKAITLLQPWASLCVTPMPKVWVRGDACRSPLCQNAQECGSLGCSISSPGMVKTIETRSWPAPAGLVGERLLLHAARKRPVDWRTVTNVDLPLGAIIGSAVLDACLPMVWEGDGSSESDLWVWPDGRLRLRGPAAGNCDPDRGLTGYRDVTDQLPYGDFAAGRWAWILRDAAPTTDRCPKCIDGRVCEDGVRRIQVGDGLEIGGGVLTAWSSCDRCGGSGSCPPIPWKGRQRVWECAL